MVWGQEREWGSVFPTQNQPSNWNLKALDETHGNSFSVFMDLYTWGSWGGVGCEWVTVCHRRICPHICVVRRTGPTPVGTLGYVRGFSR